MNSITDIFPRSAAYSAAVARASRSVRDSRQHYGFAYTERHLQCVWFDDFLRPGTLHSDTGENVIVDSPGRWNLEAGPDFLDAVLIVGAGKRRITGDVEIHPHPSDWERHRHEHDPRYARVVAHVSYCKGSLKPGLLPPDSVQISLEEDLAANPMFSFESIDIAAYPYAEHRHPAPCAIALAGQDLDTAFALIDAAGEERLRIKAQRMQSAIQQHGAEQALYEEVLCALGYKNNRAPFRQLARLLPINTLAKESAGDCRKAFCLLLGVSGLLPSKISSEWDDDTRTYVRQLWNFWWKQRSSLESPGMTPQSWCLTGLRPQNHPIRRMAAAAELFCGEKPLYDRVRGLKATCQAEWVTEATGILTASATDRYWVRRLSFLRSPPATETSLVGNGRAASILCNVIVPFLAAQGELPGGPSHSDLLALLPAGHDDGLIRRTAFVLLGPDHNPRMYRTALRQQGLLQVFNDFCLCDRSGCRDCILPGVIRDWTLQGCGENLPRKPC